MQQLTRRCTGILTQHVFFFNILLQKLLNDFIKATRKIFQNRKKDKIPLRNTKFPLLTSIPSFQQQHALTFLTAQKNCKNSLLTYSFIVNESHTILVNNTGKKKKNSEIFCFIQIWISQREDIWAEHFYTLSLMLFKHEVEISPF